MNFKLVLFKYVLLMAVSGSLLLISTFCTGKNNNHKDDNIFICGQDSPQWFKDEIRIIAKNSPVFKPIKVFLIKDNDTEYIAIEDHSKNSTEKIRVFLCTGTRIDSCEKEYASIVKKYNNNEARIIWPD